MQRHLEDHQKETVRRYAINQATPMEVTGLIYDEISKEIAAYDEARERLARATMPIPRPITQIEVGFDPGSAENGAFHVGRSELTQV